MSEYTAAIVSPKELSSQDLAALAQLYLAHYDGSSQEQFSADLLAKDEVLLVHCRGSLIGFSALQIYERPWAGRIVRIVYSGDTVVDRRHWGQQALAGRWIARMGELRRERPDLPLYWFLIVKGHRTFKYLPVFCTSFHPHWAEDRSDLKPLADALAAEKFGESYNPSTGLVQFTTSRGHLKADISLPAQRELARPAVRFFLERNPGYARGDELVCLCELEEENMRPLTRRLFRRT